MQRYARRVWWMEATRGALALAFSVALDAQTLVIHLLVIHVLGTAIGLYICLDGALDLYSMLSGRRGRARTVRWMRSVKDGLIAVFSVVIGGVSVWYPLLALYALVGAISARVLWSGAREIRLAIRRQSKRPLLSLALGSVLLAGGLSILALGGLTLAFQLLLTFLSVYMFIYGAYLLVRAYRLRFGRLRGQPLAIAPTPGTLDHATPNAWRAMVFIRRTGASGLGHVGWAFEWPNGWFNAGSVENRTGRPFVQPKAMGFWTLHTLDPIASMQKQTAPYGEYKVFYVATPDIRAAWRTVVWISRTPYLALRHNCCDVVYDVLRAFGVACLLDPARESVPNDWYDMLPGASYPISAYPSLALNPECPPPHACALRELAPAIAPSATGSVPPWRVNGQRAWVELLNVWDEMVARTRLVVVRRRA